MVMTLYSLYAWRIGQGDSLESMKGIMRFQVSFGFMRTILLHPRINSSKFIINGGRDNVS